MDALQTKLAGKKTYIIGIVGVLTALGGYLAGDMTIAQAGQAVLTSLLAMGLRHGIS